MASENPDDHQRVEAADENKKKKKKPGTDRKYRANQKQKVKQLQNDCSNYKNEANHYKKKMKSILDVALDTEEIVLEHGESSGHAREAVEKQTDFLNSMSRELLKTTLPGGGTCGSTSASTDKDAYPPLELSVIAMKSDGSVTTESYEQCKSLPEEWTPLAVGGRERLIRAFFGLREHYTATTIRHAQEIAKRDHDLVRHAQEIAKRDHELVRHAQEIAKRDHELEKLKVELKWAQEGPCSNQFVDEEPQTL